MIDGERLRPLLSLAYRSDTEFGDHPHIDVIVLMKLPALQQWSGLSDSELERQASDRISFRYLNKNRELTGSPRNFHLVCLWTSVSCLFSECS
ncbi:transposase [Methanosphaerula palustris]|uniref:transposase n=1 Tax=Methanosphaerula palustris TaxID=475088 RepID=UPI00130529A9